MYLQCIYYIDIPRYTCVCIDTHLWSFIHALLNVQRPQGSKFYLPFALPSFQYVNPSNCLFRDPESYLLVIETNGYHVMILSNDGQSNGKQDPVTHHWSIGGWGCKFGSHPALQHWNLCTENLKSPRRANPNSNGSWYREVNDFTAALFCSLGQSTGYSVFDTLLKKGPQ